MYDLGKDEIPAEFMEKGRNLDEVLQKYMEYYGGSEKVADLLHTDEESKPEDRFARMIACAVYRVYALGFEDGMNAGKKG